MQGNQAATNGLDHGTKTLTVVTITDNPKTIPGLGKCLAKDSSISSIRCVTANTEIASICRRNAPCVLVLERKALEAFNLIAFASEADIGGSVKSLVIVDEEDPALSIKLLRLGFSGTLRRTCSPRLLGRALRAVAEGELWAPRKTIAALVRELVVDDNPKKLTGRERQILNLIANGHKNQQIADSLFITRETVRWHVRSIYSKLGVSGREHAIEYAEISKGLPHKRPAILSQPTKTGQQLVG